MRNAKPVIFEDEDVQKEEPVFQSLEQLKEDKLEPTEEEIEDLFKTPPIQVKEAPVYDTVVEVTPIRDFPTRFGGVQYYFTKDKKQRVPLALRDFLLLNKDNPKIKDIW